MMENNNLELTCICCPRGCLLQVETEHGLVSHVEGAFCKKGSEYAAQEITNPVRVLTALMRVDGYNRPLSVKTDRPVPKHLLMKCAREIYRTHPSLPVHAGDIVLRNLCNTGANVIATGDTEENRLIKN